MESGRSEVLPELEFESEILGVALWDIPSTPCQPLGFSPAERAFGRH